MRQNWLSNRISKSFDDIVDHCCYAWNTLIEKSTGFVATRTRTEPDGPITRRPSRRRGRSARSPRRSPPQCFQRFDPPAAFACAAVVWCFPATPFPQPPAQTAAARHRCPPSQVGALAGAIQTIAAATTPADARPPKPPPPQQASLQRSAPCHPPKTDGATPFS